MAASSSAAARLFSRSYARPQAGGRGPAAAVAPRPAAPRRAPPAPRRGNAAAARALAIPTAQWGSDDGVSVTALQAILGALFGAGSEQRGARAAAAPGVSAAPLFSSM
jgi:hypothetical protein